MRIKTKMQAIEEIKRETLADNEVRKRFNDVGGFCIAAMTPTNVIEQ